MAIRLPNWPFEAQLDSVTQDGMPDENRANNCGETCDSMTIKWGLDVFIAPDTIKDSVLVLGQNAVGYSYVSQNSDYLNSKGVTTRYEEVPDAVEAMTRADNWLRQGKPTIVLFKANRVTLTGGHFMEHIGIDDTSNHVQANPWIGGPEGLAPAEWQRIYNGWLLYCDITAHNRAPAPVPKSGARFLVLRDMMARRNPKLDVTPSNIYFEQNGKPQLVHTGAVLNGTGQQTPHFVQVTAGANRVWLWLENVRAV